MHKDYRREELVDDNRKIELQIKYPYLGKNNGESQKGLIESIIGLTENIKSKVVAYTSTVLPNYYKIFEYYRRYNSSIGWNNNIISEWNGNNILKLDNGYMSVTCEKSNENELIDKVIKIREFVDFLGGGAEKKQKWNKFLLY